MPARWSRILTLLLVAVLASGALPRPATAADPTIVELPGPGTAWLGKFVIGPDGNLWFPEFRGNKMVRFTPEGVITEFPLPPSASDMLGGNGPYAIAVGPDGNLWYTNGHNNTIGRFTLAGAVTEFPVPTPDGGLGDITLGPDGNLWFTETSGDKIGRISVAGAIREFPVPTRGSAPADITTGPDGNLWFTEIRGNAIGRSTPDGKITEFPLASAKAFPGGIGAGPDGNLWFTEQGRSAIGRITTTGTITEFPLPDGPEGAWSIAAGPDGNLWYARGQAWRIGRISTTGVVTEFPVTMAGKGPNSIAAGPRGSNTLWYLNRFANTIGRITLPAPAPAPAGDVCFPGQTPFCIAGRFRSQWESHGGLAVNGYPLTGEFTETLGGKPYTVQYFERVRMEYHPEVADPRYQVLLGQFGRQLHPADPPVAAVAGARFFPETGHNVTRRAFVDYWQANGGLDQFGFPLAEEFEETLNGQPYRVQYFERARFEWHPENADPSYQVLLGQFGRQICGERCR